MSVGFAGVNSMIFVEGENCTEAAPLGPLTSILLPDTDAIDPTTSSSPLIFSGVWDATADVVLGRGDDPPALVSAEPQATADSVVTPTTARIVQRVIATLGMVDSYPTWV
ncbi:MAG: hypothetical protein U0S13_08485 [Mycobacterium sp.]